jgi:hypothetical protein
MLCTLCSIQIIQHLSLLPCMPLLPTVTLLCNSTPSYSYLLITRYWSPDSPVSLHTTPPASGKHCSTLNYNEIDFFRFHPFVCLCHLLSFSSIYNVTNDKISCFLIALHFIYLYVLHYMYTYIFLSSVGRHRLTPFLGCCE